MQAVFITDIACFLLLCIIKMTFSAYNIVKIGVPYAESGGGALCAELQEQ